VAMPKIPIKYVIDSGAWFKCRTNDNNEFKLRVNTFNILDHNIIDKPEQLNHPYDFSQGNLWLINIDLVNLNKQDIDALSLYSRLAIIDHDDCYFSHIEDYHLMCYSQCSITYGLNKLFGTRLMPKIKYNGTIPRYLPNEDNA
jgi:hypothetical protein